MKTQFIKNIAKSKINKNTNIQKKAQIKIQK